MALEPENNSRLRSIWASQVAQMVKNLPVMVQKERSLTTAFSRSRGPPAFSQIVNEDENLSLKMSNASDTP